MPASPQKIKAPPEGNLAQLLAVLEDNTTLLAFFFGLCFVSVLLVLALCFPQPTAFQYMVFRITLALAAAGVAGIIPGMIRLTVKPGTALLIHAGGALAVFVMVYLLAPAALPSRPPVSSPSPPNQEKKAASKPQPLKISNVDAIENGAHVLYFTPPGAVHIARISNIGNTQVYISLVGFPEQYFYTNLAHEDLTFNEHADKEMRVVLKCNVPAQDEYIFQINDSAGGTTQVALRLNKGWDQFLARQIQYIQYKDGQGASPAELHQEAKQLVAASEAKELPAPLQEALAGQLLAAAGQPNAAALAYAKAEKGDSKLAERFIAYSPPEVMTALADTYKRASDTDKEKHWRSLAGKISPASKQQNHDAERADARASKRSKIYGDISADHKTQEESDDDKTDISPFNFAEQSSLEDQEDVLRYVDNRDGTITDTKTGLMWKRCSEGLSGADCEKGKMERYIWDDAVQNFKNVEYAGYADWRLPTIDELKTLVYCSNGIKDKICNDGSERPRINQQAFPNTAWAYWSGSPSAGYSGYAWYVSFHYGNSGSDPRDYVSAVRLVRGGQ
jgi:hypothetical protein